MLKLCRYRSRGHLLMVARGHDNQGTQRLVDVVCRELDAVIIRVLGTLAALKIDC